MVRLSVVWSKIKLVWTRNPGIDSNNDWYCKTMLLSDLFRYNAYCWFLKMIISLWVFRRGWTKKSAWFSCRITSLGVTTLPNKYMLYFTAASDFCNIEVNKPPEPDQATLQNYFLVQGQPWCIFSYHRLIRLRICFSCHKLVWFVYLLTRGIMG